MMPSTPVVTAAAPDAGWIAELIGGAFQHLGVAEWLVPDPVERARILPRNFEILVEWCIAHGEAHVTTDRSAVAIWVPRGFDALPPPVDYEARVAAACGVWTERFFDLDALFDKHHPAQPHQHLAFLAVRVGSQGGGLGSLLLRSYHERLDGDGLPAFLEASSTGSRDLYLRHGYRLVGEPYAVPNGARFWPMWRDPQPPGAPGASRRGT